MAFLPAQGGSVFKKGGGIFGALERSGIGQAIADAMEQQRKRDLIKRQLEDTEARTGLLERQVDVQELTETRLQGVVDEAGKAKQLATTEQLSLTYFDPETGTNAKANDFIDEDGNIVIPERMEFLSAGRQAQVDLAQTIQAGDPGNISDEEAFATAGRILRKRSEQGQTLAGQAIEQGRATINLTKAKTAAELARAKLAGRPAVATDKNVGSLLTTVAAAQGVIDATSTQPHKIRIHAKGVKGAGIGSGSGVDWIIAPIASAGAVGPFGTFGGLKDIGVNAADIETIFSDMPSLLQKLEPTIKGEGTGVASNQKAIRDFLVREIIALPSVQAQFQENLLPAMEKMREKSEFKNKTDEELMAILEKDMLGATEALATSILKTSTVESDENLDPLTDERNKVPLGTYLDKTLSAITSTTKLRDAANQNLINLAPSLADDAVRDDVLAGQAALDSGDMGTWIDLLNRANGRGQGDLFLSFFGGSGGSGTVDLTGGLTTPSTAPTVPIADVPGPSQVDIDSANAMIDTAIAKVDRPVVAGLETVTVEAEEAGLLEPEIIEPLSTSKTDRIATRRATEVGVGLNDSATITGQARNKKAFIQANAIITQVISKGKDPSEAVLRSLSDKLGPAPGTKEYREQVKTLQDRLDRARRFLLFVQSSSGAE